MQKTSSVAGKLRCSCKRCSLWNSAVRNELQMGQTNRRTDGVQCIMRPPSGRPQAWIRFVATQNTVSYNIAVLRRLYSRISTRSSALQHVRFCINILRRRVHYTNPLVYTGWPRSHYIILWRIKRRLSYCQCTRLKLVPPSQRGNE